MSIRVLFLLFFLFLFAAGCGKEDSDDAGLLAATNTKLQGRWIFYSRLNEYYNAAGQRVHTQTQGSDIVMVTFAGDKLEYTFRTENPDRDYTFATAINGNKTNLSTFRHKTLQASYELIFSNTNEMIWVAETVGNYYYTQDGANHPATRYKRTLTFIRQ